MRVRRMSILTMLGVAGCTAAALVAGSATSQATSAARPGVATTETGATGALVSVDGPGSGFLRNLQAQPAVAVDPAQPGLLAGTGYDMMDMQQCSKQAAVTAAACSLPADPADGGTWNPGVGDTGVFFSFNSGHDWIQPVYQGLTTAGCDPTATSCTAKPGPIHTVPNYYENGLVAFGDSYVAFGPVPKNGRFSWSNGSRLYVSDVATNLTGTAIRPGTIDSISTMAVSHIDDPTPARVASQPNWSAPVIVPKTEPAISSPGGDVVWADNASSSRYFGHVYMCYNDYYFPASGNTDPIYPTIAVSADGGQTWTTHHVAAPIDSAAQGYRAGCSIRTDSHGNVYAVFTHFEGTFPSTKLAGSQDLVTSANGGATWTKPVAIMTINDACYFVEPVDGFCAEEGPGGNPDIPVPSLDIANGAPTGAHATNELALAWTDGRFGQNHEATLLSYSTDSARTWSAPQSVSLPSDRSVYSAVALAPDGSRVYVTYQGLTTPFAPSTSTPRLVRGVLLSAVIGPGGAPADWVTDYTGPAGDARGTGLGQYNFEEFLGFYIGAAATDTYGIGIWTDMSRAADCPAMDAWREASYKAAKVVTPAPWPLADCPANFGNSDIRSATTAP